MRLHRRLTFVYVNRSPKCLTCQSKGTPAAHLAGNIQCIIYQQAYNNLVGLLLSLYLTDPAYNCSVTQI